jgi:hypothetical protein
MRAAPPALPADTPASCIHQDQDQLANAPESPLKPTHLATTTTTVNRGSCSQYSKGGSSASPRSQRDEICDNHTTNFAKGYVDIRGRRTPVVSLLLHVPRTIV